MTRRWGLNGWITHSSAIRQITVSAISGAIFLLIYQADAKQINFVRAGTYSGFFSS